jgi:hypothetical protein
MPGRKQRRLVRGLHSTWWSFRQLVANSISIQAYPGPDLPTTAAKVVDQSRKKSRKVAEGCRTKEKVSYEFQSFTIISNKF